MTYPAIYYPQHSQDKSANRRQLKAQELLFGLIELYIQSGKPIGSQTLKAEGFAHLSSATIRNYFALLDKEGYLEQAHTSGGRIPTDQAWRCYFDQCTIGPIQSSQLGELESTFATGPYTPSHHGSNPSHALHDSLSLLCDSLAKWSRCASFLLTPSFEQDSPTHLKIWPFQEQRWVLLTRSQMGFFRHEVIALSQPTAGARIPMIEQALERKIHNPLAGCEQMSEQERLLLGELYNELMVRHLLHHTHPGERLWLRSGLSNLLSYSELADADRLGEALYFFEHRRSKEKLLHLMQSNSTTRAWIGQEVRQLFLPGNECSLLTCPYFVHQQMVGLVGLIGPRRIPYTQLRHGLEYVARLISHHLTREYHAFRLAYDFKSPPR